MAPLVQDDIIRTLLAARARLSAGFIVVLRDSHLAEDVFQEVMVKALAPSAVFASEAQLLSWARAVGRNSSLNQLRKHERVQVGLPESLLDTLEREWEQERAAATPREEALKACLEGLPEKSLQLLNLRYFHGLSCQDTAARLSLGLEAVYQRLSRLHRALRECVDRRLAGSEEAHP